MFTFIVHGIAFWMSVIAILNAITIVVYLQFFDWMYKYVDELDRVVARLNAGFVSCAFIAAVATVVERFV